MFQDIIDAFLGNVQGLAIILARSLDMSVHSFV